MDEDKTNIFFSLFLTGFIFILYLFYAFSELCIVGILLVVLYSIILFMILYTEKLHTRAHIFLYTFCCCSFTSTSTFASEESAAHSKRDLPFTHLCCKFNCEYWVCSDKTVARMHHNEPDVSGSAWALIRFSIQVTGLLCYENKINGVN